MVGDTGKMKTVREKCEGDAGREKRIKAAGMETPSSSSVTFLEAAGGREKHSILTSVVGQLQVAGAGLRNAIKFTFIGLGLYRVYCSSHIE